MATKSKPTQSRKGQIIALIVAGGSGERLGGGIPKQYREIAGKSLLRRSIEAFLAHPDISAVRVVIRKEDKTFYQQTTKGLKLLLPVVGGKTRQQSVFKGLKSLEKTRPDGVLIHDAARPLVSKGVIDRIIKAMEKNLAVVPVIAVADTVKRVEGAVVKETLPRPELVAAQTPQGFAYEYIFNAHQQVGDEAYPDDAAIMEKVGYTVKTVEGDLLNFKITTEEDMQRAENVQGGGMETRVGQGYDVHAFEEGKAKQLMLCGVKVPHEKKLKGHSDADVGLHALTDAMLGAIAREDIGAHFSPKNKKWKNADSTLFVKHALELLTEQGGRLVHADITIIGEAPKVSPHREAMRKKIATILKVDISRVSVKATTTEKLGFLGRKEGLAAEALVTVELPKGK